MLKPLKNRLSLQNDEVIFSFHETFSKVYRLGEGAEQFVFVGCGS